MYKIVAIPRFARDVKACRKRHWDMQEFEQTIGALAHSDEAELAARYRDHAIVNLTKPTRAVHVPSRGNPPRDTWVIVYRIYEPEHELVLLRTGTHDVYHSLNDH